MANPFPGMDPYLEDTIWQTVHAQLATQIALALAPRVRPKYVVLTTERVVLTSLGDGNRQVRLPDVGVVSDQPAGTGSAAAVAAPLTANAIELESVPQFAVEVRDARDRRLVTAIEILSPTNKSGTGQVEYAAKRRELLAGDAHLVEIDLLRAGSRFPLDKPLPSVPYFAFVSRADRRPAVDIWPMPLRSPMPEVPIPLDPGDADVPLDLQAIFDRLHDTAGYDLSVDYARAPAGDLPPDDLAWIDERLRAAGRRP
jgi:hypothetical protein